VTGIVLLKGRAAAARLAILDREEPSVPVYPVERKLAAVFADIAGYSGLMARDEVGALAD
jgi:class 3 adenylate cyclase